MPFPKRQPGVTTAAAPQPSGSASLSPSGCRPVPAQLLLPATGPTGPTPTRTLPNRFVTALAATSEGALSPTPPALVASPARGWRSHWSKTLPLPLAPLLAPKSCHTAKQGGAYPQGGGGGWHDTFGYCSCLQLAGAYWLIAICCPSLGPFPSVGGGTHRPLSPPVSFLCLLAQSVPLHFPFLSLGRLCQQSPLTFPVSPLCVGSTQRRATVLAVGQVRPSGHPKPALRDPSRMATFGPWDVHLRGLFPQLGHITTFCLSIPTLSPPCGERIMHRRGGGNRLTFEETRGGRGLGPKSVFRNGKFRCFRRCCLWP